MIRPSCIPPFLLLALLGCESEPPALSGVAPSIGPPGTEVVITGAHLTETVTIKMGGEPLQDARFVDENTIHGTVPEGLNAGPIDLLVSDASGRQMNRSDAFVVEATAPPEHPCQSTEKRFTAIPPDGSVVKIDRHLPDGTVDRKRFPTSQIASIELRRLAMPDPPPGSADNTAAEDPPTCSTIYLLLEGDKGRVLFDSDDKVDLKSQAQKIAQGLGKRLVLAQGMPE